MNTKKSLTQIGKILVEENGKQEFYSPQQVKKAHEKMKTETFETTYDSIGFLELAMSLYSPVEDFIQHFSSNAVDYLKLKTEALKEISESDWDIFPDIDIDMSWLDAGDIFEGIIEGIGSFFSAIFEGLS